MHNRILALKVYATAYGDLATQNVKNAASKTAQNISENKKELMILTGTSSVAYFTGRVVGFRAGHAHATTSVA